MVRKNVITRFLLRFIPDNDQGRNERKLRDVMKSLKVNSYKFNWDRAGCYVEFNYNGDFYRLEHSVERAQKKGIVLRNGLDCLMELTHSLEDLCNIIDRGMDDFETWMAGMRQPSSDPIKQPSSPMKQPSSEPILPEYQEELEIRYKTLGRNKNYTEKNNYPEYDKEELDEELPLETERLLRKYEQSRFNS